MRAESTELPTISICELPEIVMVEDSIYVRAVVNFNLLAPTYLNWFKTTPPFVLVTDKSAAIETSPSVLNVKFPLKLADKTCPGMAIPLANHKVHAADTVVDPVVDNRQGSLCGHELSHAPIHVEPLPLK